MRLDSSPWLYEALCAKATPSGNYTFPSTVTRPSNVLSGGLECGVDTLRVAEVGTTGVFYEFKRPPCVELAFFAGGKAISSRAAPDSTSATSPCAPTPWLWRRAGPAAER